jgi:hypothetical protein
LKSAIPFTAAFRIKTSLEKKQKRLGSMAFLMLMIIQNHPAYCHFPENIRTQLLLWHKNGYLIWERFLDEETVDAVNNEIDGLLEKKEVDFNYTNRKIFNAYHQSLYDSKNHKRKTIIGITFFYFR